MAPLDISGEKFGRLTAVRRDGSDAHGKARWIFACDCGGEIKATASLVKRGATQSCGCLRQESAAQNGLAGGKKPRHGATYKTDPMHAEYCIWKTMRQRCTNPNSADFIAYGWRGITVCDRWDRFENFAADMGNRPSSQHSIDRVDTSGNYEPGNCRWSDDFEQAANRRPRGTGEYETMRNH